MLDDNTGNRDNSAESFRLVANASEKSLSLTNSKLRHYDSENPRRNAFWVSLSLTNFDLRHYNKDKEKVLPVNGQPRL